MKKTVRIYHIQDYICTPGTGCVCEFWEGESPLHVHGDFYEISLITAGNFENIYDGQKMKLERNDLVFYRVGARHEFYPIEGDSVMCNFLMDEELFAEYSQLFEWDKKIGEQEMLIRKLTDVQANYLIALAKDCMDNTRANLRKDYFRLLAVNLFTWICMEPIGQVKALNKYTKELLQRMDNFKYINYHVRDIYREFPVADSALCTNFREQVGCTVIHYNNKKKMEYAAQKLMLGEYTITEISNKLNFSSVSYFIRKFKEHFGVTPREFQKTHTKVYYFDFNEFK